MAFLFSSKNAADLIKFARVRTTGADGGNMEHLSSSRKRRVKLTILSRTNPILLHYSKERTLERLERVLNDFGEKVFEVGESGFMGMNDRHAIILRLSNLNRFDRFVLGRVLYVMGYTVSLIVSVGYRDFNYYTPKNLFFKGNSVIYTKYELALSKIEGQTNLDSPYSDRVMEYTSYYDGWSF